MNYKENLAVNPVRDELILRRELAIYCARGWVIHPLSGKLPILKDWQNKATSNIDVALQWFKEWPQANVGIVTGLINNLLVLDIDGSEGLSSIADLDLPEAPSVLTARGLHYYFNFPKALEKTPTTRAGILPGVDTRGRGGYIVAPPSTHETGHQYHWLKSLDGSLFDPPTWLIQKLSPPPREANKPPTFIIGNTSNYACAALRNESTAVAMAPTGTRNSRLNLAAFSMGTLIAAGGIDIRSVAVALTQAGLNAGLSRNEIQKTLTNGLSAGMQYPREVFHG